MYEDWYKRGGELEEENLELFIKVTDYKKGYWAETPLNRSEVQALIEYLKDYLEQIPSLGSE